MEALINSFEITNNTVVLGFIFRIYFT